MYPPVGPGKVWVEIFVSRAPGRRQRTEPGRDGLNRLIVEGLRHAAHDEVVGGVMRQVFVKAREPRDEIRRVLPAQRRIDGILTGADRGSPGLGAVAPLTWGNAARWIAREKQRLALAGCRRGGRGRRRRL